MMTPEELAAVRERIAFGFYDVNETRLDARSLLAHVDAQAARVAELEAALRGFRSGYCWCGKARGNPLRLEGFDHSAECKAAARAIEGRAEG
jgi:hypothetical protein